MADKAWKRNERRVAAMFNTTRTPLSGGNSKQTSSDTLHPRCYIETKYRKKHANVDLFIDTAAKAGAEQKFPVVVLVQRGLRTKYAIVPLKMRYLYTLLSELQAEQEDTDHAND